MSKRALPPPDAADIENLKRFVLFPEDFLCQDHDLLLNKRPRRKCVRYRSRRINANPDRHKLRVNSFAYMNSFINNYPWPDLDFIGVILQPDRPVHKNLLLFQPIYRTLQRDRYQVTNTLGVYTPFYIGSEQLCWLRVLRNPYRSWSILDHVRMPKSIRRAVQTVMMIWTLEPENMLGVLPFELLQLVFVEL